METGSVSHFSHNSGCQETDRIKGQRKVHRASGYQTDGHSFSNGAARSPVSYTHLMAQPFYMQYEVTYNNGANCQDSFEQFLHVYDLMKDTRNGLYYHAYDDSRESFWCDPVTGLSDNFWLRALGWYAMALIDTMEVMPGSMAQEKEKLGAIYKELIDAMLPYQDKETGMWYQVVNRGRIKPNYLETSGSAIFAYAIMKLSLIHISSK